MAVSPGDGGVGVLRGFHDRLFELRRDRPAAAPLRCSSQAFCRWRLFFFWPVFFGPFGRGIWDWRRSRAGRAGRSSCNATEACRALWGAPSGLAGVLVGGEIRRARGRDVEVGAPSLRLDSTSCSRSSRGCRIAIGWSLSFLGCGRKGNRWRFPPRAAAVIGPSQSQGSIRLCHASQRKGLNGAPRYGLFRLREGFSRAFI